MTSLITTRDVARPVHRARWSRDGPWGHAHITTSWHGGPLSLLQSLAAVHSDMSLCALLLDTPTRLSASDRYPGGPSWRLGTARVPLGSAYASEWDGRGRGRPSGAEFLGSGDASSCGRLGRAVH